MPFEALLSSGRDEVSRMRLARCLVELAKVVGRMNPASAVAAQGELAARLARVLGRDSGGRLCPLQVRSFCPCPVGW